MIHNSINPHIYIQKPAALPSINLNLSANAWNSIRAASVFRVSRKVSSSLSLCRAALRRTFSHFLRSRAANFPYRVSPVNEKWWATSAAKLPLPRLSLSRLRIEFRRNRRSRIISDAHVNEIYCIWFQFEARTSDAMVNIYASDAQFRNSFSRSSVLYLIDVAVHLVWIPLMQLQLLGERRRKNGQLLWAWLINRLGDGEPSDFFFF